MDVVVVGAGLGGLRTVEGLRRRGVDATITLVGAEQHAPYDRPPLTKQVLRGERDDTTLTDDLDGLDVTLRLGTQAVALNTDDRRITLADGSFLGYDVLVLAPGAAPRTLPGVPQRPGLHVVRTIDDATRLRTALRDGGSVVVVGGGFIGCEVAAGARALGAEVDLVELLPAPLIRVLGPTGSSIVTDLLVEHGVRVHAGTGLDEVFGDDHVTGVRLGDGTRIDTTDVVLGLGVVPEVGWLEGSGVQVDDGIVCDSSGRTSVPGVYAVGDAARWHHPLAGAHRRIEHWTNAVEQAGAVAATIAADHGDGEAPEHGTVPYFWSDLFDVKVQALGFVDAEDHTDVRTPGGRTVVVHSRGGRVRAVVGFSAARHIMKLRARIAEGAPVEEILAALDA